MKSRNLLMASAVIAVLAAGCSGGSGNGALKLEKTSIVVDAFPAIDSAGLYIAQMKGLFAAQGLKVTIVPAQAAPPTTQSLNNVAFPDAAAQLAADSVSAAFVPEPFVSQDEEGGFQELADLDQGSTLDFPIEGYAVTRAWAQRYPHTLQAFTRALSQGQEIADTDRGAVESAIERYLNMLPTTAASISLPNFPTAVDSVRLQRVVSTMARFGLLPQRDASFQMSSMTG